MHAGLFVVDVDRVGVVVVKGQAMHAIIGRQTGNRRSGQVKWALGRRGEARQDGRARSPGTQRGSSEMMVR